MRIGTGYDVHRLTEDRELILQLLDSDGDFRVRAGAVSLLPYPEERERIIADSVGNIDGLCDGCSPGLLRMYQEYIEGRKELREINMEFCGSYVSGIAGPEKGGCSFAK